MGSGDIVDFRPSIAPEIHALRPDFRALSIVAMGACNAFSDEQNLWQLSAVSRDIDVAPWSEVDLPAWRDTYRASGAKPQRTPCSAEALRKRYERGGGLPPANAIVDLYSAISLRYTILAGGEDASAYRGTSDAHRDLAAVT